MILILAGYGQWNGSRNIQIINQIVPISNHIALGTQMTDLMDRVVQNIDTMLNSFTGSQAAMIRQSLSQMQEIIDQIKASPHRSGNTYLLDKTELKLQQLDTQIKRLEKIQPDNQAIWILYQSIDFVQKDIQAFMQNHLAEQSTLLALQRQNSKFTGIIMSFVSLAILIVIMIIYKISTHSISKPIMDLQQAMKSFAKGEAFHLIITRFDEVADLGRSFLEMSQQLQSAQELLQDQNLALESQVTARTTELQDNLDLLEEEIVTREALQKELENTVTLMRTLMNTMPLPFFYENAQGVYLEVNQAFTEISGMKREQIIGATAHDLSSSGLAAIDHQADLDLIKNEINHVYETEVKFADQSLHQVIFHKAIVRDVEGTVTGILGIMQDITVHKKMEESLQNNLAVLSLGEILAKIGNFEQNWTTGEVQWSDGFKRILGLDENADIPLNADFIKFIIPEDRERVAAHIQETLQNKQMMDIEFKIQQPNGQIIFVHAVALSHDNDDGKPFKTVGIFKDITQIKEGEHQNMILQNQLHNAQRLEAIGTLAAGIAHEINTPVQFISDNTSFIKDELGKMIDLLNSYRQHRGDCAGGRKIRISRDELAGLEQSLDIDYLLTEIPNALTENLEGLNRVKTIVTAMKSFSRADDQTKSPVDINEALRNAITISRNEWKYVADIDTQFQSDLPMFIGFNHDLQQAFMNLIVNAAHAIQSKIGENALIKGKILITTSAQKEKICISIQDSGGGIPPEIRNKIFDPFFTTKEVGKGTGQGLSIVYSTIVEHHGGEIQIDSVEGQGASFILTLPLVMNDAEEDVIG